MAKMPEIIEPEVDEAEKIIHEYRQGISQAKQKKNRPVL